MIYLFLSILFSSSIFIIFKLYGKFNINSLQAIIYNYGVASICGVLAHEQPLQLHRLSQYDWFYYTVGLGLVFITIFNVMAITAQRNGLSVVAIASKMSVIIPIIFGFLLYNENIGWVKVTGIILALISIYLVTANPDKVIKEGSFLYPLIVFIGSGFIDTSLKYLQTTYVKEDEVSLFSASIFAFAFIIGVVVFISQLIKNTFKFELKNLIGGVILGVINYYTIYFIIKAISYKNMESSTIFTINNVSILLITTILGVVIFNEKLNTKNKLGILLASIGIIFVSLSSHF